MNPEPPPATPAPAGSKFGATLADLLVAGGSLIILLFSWGRMVSYPSIYRGLIPDSQLPGLSLWSWLRPLGIFVILATILLLISAAVDTWWKRDKQMVGLNRHHVQVGLALYVLVTIFGMAMAGGAGYGVGWGGVIQLLGALIATAGAVLNHFNLLQNQLSVPNPMSRPATYQSAGYQQPSGYQSQGGYVPPAQGGPSAGTTAADPTTPLPPQNPPNA